MDWSVEFWIVFMYVVAGLALGFVLYYFVFFRMVPVRPNPDEDACKKIAKQEILNKQIQAKKDRGLDDESLSRPQTH